MKLSLLPALAEHSATWILDELELGDRVADALKDGEHER